jgi:hypothetical protein
MRLPGCREVMPEPLKYAADAEQGKCSEAGGGALVGIRKVSGAGWLIWDVGAGDARPGMHGFAEGLALRRCDIDTLP